MCVCVRGVAAAKYGVALATLTHSLTRSVVGGWCYAIYYQADVAAEAFVVAADAAWLAGMC